MREEMHRTTPASRSSTLLDPTLTLVRLPVGAIGFYDRIVERMDPETRDADHGVMFHFSAANDDELFVVTAYRSPTDAALTFAHFTASEVADTVADRGGAPDITRHELVVDRYIIRADGFTNRLRFTEPGDYVAMYSDDERLTRDSHLAAMDEIGFPNEWPDGLLISVFGDINGRWAVFDLWRGDADAAGFYRATPVTESLAVHSLQVNSDVIRGDTEYVRAS